MKFHNTNYTVIESPKNGRFYALGHSAKNWNLAFSAFLGEMSILGSQEVIAKIGSIAKIGLPIRPDPD
jgi:hypothetical protein